MTIGPTQLALMPRVMSPSSTPLQNLDSSASSRGFLDLLNQAMSGVNARQMSAEHLIEENLLGHGVTDVEVLTAMKQAELSMKTAIQVRNKAVDALNELKQTQL